jgi:hypothetical protein
MQEEEEENEEVTQIMSWKQLHLKPDESFPLSDCSVTKLRAVLTLPSPRNGLGISLSKKKLIRTLIEISQGDDIVETIRAERGIYLVKLISTSDPDVQILGCLLLAKQIKFVPEETLKMLIPTLIQFLESNSCSQGLSVREVALIAIRRISMKGEDLRVKLGRLGVFTSLLTLVSSSTSQNDVRTQILVLQTMRELVLCTKENQVMLFRVEGVQIILELVASSSLLDTAKCLCVEILGILSSLRDVRREIANRSGVSIIIEAIKVGSMDARTRGAHALGLLSLTKRVRRMIVDAGGIPVLVDLLRDGDEGAKLVAGNSLGLVSACVDHLWHVAHAGAIPLYINLLESGNPHGKDITKDVFCILAVSEENALTIVDHLVRILLYGDVESKVAAADILWDLACYRHSVSVVVVSGAIPVLVGLLKHENGELRENVVGTIAQLTKNDEDRQVLAENGVIPMLVDLLQDPSTEVKGNAAEALHNFAEDAEYRSQIIDACVVPGIILFQGNGRDHEGTD